MYEMGFIIHRQSIELLIFKRIMLSVMGIEKSNSYVIPKHSAIKLNEIFYTSFICLLVGYLLAIINHLLTYLYINYKYVK